MTMPEPSPSRIAQFFGVMLIVVGLLMALLCGLCTLVIVGISLSNTVSVQAASNGMIGVAVVIGGIPAVMGGLLVWAGVSVLRSGRKRRAKVKLDTFD
jgi:alkylhydroperoxidase/carboxymuconolactone decarboxylase family protein YurZ